MPTNEERRKIAETLRSGVSTTDYMSDGAFIEWLFSVVRRSCDGHILESLAYLIEPEERTCRDDGAGVFRCTRCGAFVKRGAVMDCTGAIPLRFCPNYGARVEEGE